jgi:hypothetical protein
MSVSRRFGFGRAGLDAVEGEIVASKWRDSYRACEIVAVS